MEIKEVVNYGFKNGWFPRTNDNRHFDEMENLEKYEHVTDGFNY